MSLSSFSYIFLFSYFPLTSFLHSHLFFDWLMSSLHATTKCPFIRILLLKQSFLLTVDNTYSCSFWAICPLSCQRLLFNSVEDNDCIWQVLSVTWTDSAPRGPDFTCCLMAGIANQLGRGCRAYTIAFQRHTPEGSKGILIEVELPNSCCAFKKPDSAYLLSKLTEAESLASPYKGVSSW